MSSIKKPKINDEERSLISLNVSHNESNIQLVTNMVKSPMETGLFSANNNPQMSLSSSKRTQNNNQAQGQSPLNILNGSTIKKSFKEDEEINIKNPFDNNRHDSHQSSRSNNTQNDIEDLNRCLFKREKICDTDTEDECSDNEKEVPWIILPDNPYKRLWDLLISGIILYSAIVTPYEIAFDDSTKQDDWSDIFLDVLLMLDIVFTFFSAYTDNEENLIKSHKKIIFSYLKSWFIIDFISVLPINLLTPSTSFQFNRITRLGKLPKLYRLLKLAKLLRITKMSSHGNMNKITRFILEKLKVNGNIEKFIFFLFTFLLLNHLCACFWYFMAKIQDMNPDSWVVRLGYIDSSNLDIYIISFYWTLTTVTTVGYGDISSGTTVERIYNLFIMSFGVLLYSFAIGSLSSIVATMDKKSAEMNEKLSILSSIKKEFSLNDEIYDKVRKVIKFDLTRNHKDKMTFLQELPNKLRIELSQIMHDKVIQNLIFFRDQPNDFFAYVAPLLKPVKFSQDDYLYKYQDMINEMYFVIKGTVIFCLEKKYGEKELKEIKKDYNFGEIEMCLNETLIYSIKIKSKNCELFVMKKTDFLRLSVNFKAFIESFLQNSLMKYLSLTKTRRNMIKEFEQMMEKTTVAQKNKDANNNTIIERNDSQEGLKTMIAEKNIFEKEDEENDRKSNDSNDDEEKGKGRPMERDSIHKRNSVDDKQPNSLRTSSMYKGLSEKNVNESYQKSLQANENKGCDQIDILVKKKIDKIICFLEKDAANLSSMHVDPKELLRKLRSAVSIEEKCELLDQIDVILKENYRLKEKEKEKERE